MSKKTYIPQKKHILPIAIVVMILGILFWTIHKRQMYSSIESYVDVEPTQDHTLWDTNTMHLYPNQKGRTLGVLAVTVPHDIDFINAQTIIPRFHNHAKEHQMDMIIIPKYKDDHILYQIKLSGVSKYVPNIKILNEFLLKTKYDNILFLNHSCTLDFPQKKNEITLYLDNDGTFSGLYGKRKQLIEFLNQWKEKITVGNQIMDKYSYR